MDIFLQDKLNSGGCSADATNVVDYTAPVKAHWLGRASRREYLSVVIVSNIIFRTLSKNMGLSEGVIILSSIVGVVWIIESIRRLHDIGKSGWWALSFIIPFVWLIIWRKGQSGPNKYGPDPRAPKGGQL